MLAAAHAVLYASIVGVNVFVPPLLVRDKLLVLLSRPLGLTTSSSRPPPRLALPD